MVMCWILLKGLIILCYLAVCR